MSEKTKSVKTPQEVADQIVRISNKLYERANRLPQAKEVPVEVTHSNSDSFETAIHYNLYKTAKEVDLDDGARIDITYNGDGRTRTVDVHKGDSSDGKGKHVTHGLVTSSLFNGTKVAKTGTREEHSEAESSKSRKQSVTTAPKDILNHSAPGWDYRYENPMPEVQTEVREYENGNSKAHTSAEINVRNATDEELSRHAIRNAAETLGAIRGAIAQAEIEAQQKEHEV